MSFHDLIHHGEGVRPRTSTLLQALVEGPGERLRFADILSGLGDRAFGALLLVFTLPNCLPFPGIPGISTLMGLPLVLLSAQMALGRSAPWLPRWLGQRSVRRKDFGGFVRKLGPGLQRLERVLRPRWPGLSTPRAERALGLVCLILAIVLTLPIPMANLLTAWGILFIAIGLIEDDGLLIGFGLLVTVLALSVAVAVTFALAEGAAQLWRHWLSPG